MGLNNYQALWRDPVFWQAARNTVFFIVTIVPLQLAFGLAVGAGAEPGHPRQIDLLPADLLHAGGDDDRGRRHRLSAAAQQQRSAGRSDLLVRQSDRAAHHAAQLAQQHQILQVGGGDVDALEERRLHHGDLPGRAAGRAPGTLRRGRDRRRQRLAALPPRHRAHDQPDHLLPDAFCR